MPGKEQKDRTKVGFADKLHDNMSVDGTSASKKVAAVGNRDSWTQLRTADEMNSAKYSFSDPAFSAAMSAMSKGSVYQNYKDTINAATKANDTQRLFDMLVGLKDKINQRTPNGCVFQESSDVNGVKAVISNNEKGSPEAKAINLILKGGGNALTAMLMPSKIRTSGVSARDKTYNVLKESGMTGEDFAGKVMYGASAIEQAGDIIETAKSLGAELATVAIMDDMGQSDKADQLLQSYTPTIQKYKDNAEFVKFMVHSLVKTFSEKQKSLPVASLTAELREDIAAANDYMSSAQAQTVEQLMLARSSNNRVRQQVSGGQ